MRCCLWIHQQKRLITQGTIHTWHLLVILVFDSFSLFLVFLLSLLPFMIVCLIHPGLSSPLFTIFGLYYALVLCINHNTQFCLFFELIQVDDFYLKDLAHLSWLLCWLSSVASHACFYWVPACHVTVTQPEPCCFSACPSLQGSQLFTGRVIFPIGFASPPRSWLGTPVPILVSAVLAVCAPLPLLISLLTAWPIIRPICFLIFSSPNSWSHHLCLS